MTIDPKSQVGKFPLPDRMVDILVVGAGPAGLAAAIEAAAGGAEVMLVDENPVGLSLAGLDVPLDFGGRAGAAIAEPERMLERILAANPGLEAAFEAGVDVALGTSVFGLFINGPGARHLPCPIAALTDDRTSRHVGFRRAVLATGARDLTLFFDGSDRPGVMGAEGFHSLVARHDAFTGRRILILGTGAEAARTARLAVGNGLEIAGFVEVCETVEAPDDLPAAPIHAGHVILRATGDALGVTGAVVAPSSGGEPATIACDTIVIAVGRVPVVDLLGAAETALAYDEQRGGWVPVTADGLATATAELLVAGDCAALCTSPEEAAAHGRAAARRALSDLGFTPAANEPFVLPRRPTEGYRLAWMKALLAAGPGSVHACRCEEVTRDELLAVKPPRYLDASDAPTPPVEALDPQAPPAPDQIKRLTRAGMGPCQGRRCREQIALMLALRTGRPVGEIPLAGYRAPVRPVPLTALADQDESAQDAADWDVWFGIATQWVPYAIIDTPEEAEYLGRNMHL